MLTLTTLASGSSGNCILLSGGGEHILIDAGISCRRICRSLRALGVEPESLSGVLITHEHTDHISGLATLTKQFRLPVYASPGTARQLCYRIAALEDVLHACAPGGSFTLGMLWNFPKKLKISSSKSAKNLCVCLTEVRRRL